MLIQIPTQKLISFISKGAGTAMVDGPAMAFLLTHSADVAEDSGIVEVVISNFSLQTKSCSS